MKCLHKRVKFLSLVEEDQNTMKLLFECLDCGLIFVHTKVKA